MIIATAMMRPHEKGSQAARRRGARAGEYAAYRSRLRKLEELIVTLQLAPGAVVSETALSERLGIGRTPIREALQRLARERLIVVLPRRGIMVPEVNIRTQLRLLETRREVERLLARRAARRPPTPSASGSARSPTGWKRPPQANDDIGFMRLDREFNMLSLAAARNEFAAGAMALMHGLSRRFWYIHYKEVADMPADRPPPRRNRPRHRQRRRRRAGQGVDRLMDYIEKFTRATSLTTPNIIDMTSAIDAGRSRRSVKYTLIYQRRDFTLSRGTGRGGAADEMPTMSKRQAAFRADYRDKIASLLQRAGACR